MGNYTTYPSASGGGGVTIVSTAAILPGTGTSGDLAVTADTGSLYEFTSGTGWRQIATVGSADSTLLVGALNGAAKSVKGVVIGTNTLFMQTTDGIFPGLISSSSQNISGAKFFDTSIQSPNFVIGSTAALVTLNAVSSGGSSYSLILPGSQGLLNQTLFNNGVGSLSWSYVTTSLLVGSVSLTNQVVNNLPLSQTSGSISLTNQVSGNLPLSQTSGSISLTNQVVNNLPLSQTSGSISLTNQVVNNLPLSQTSGSISLTAQVSGVLPAANTQPLSSLTGSVSLVTQVSDLLNLTTQTQSSISLTNQVVGNLPLSQTSGSISLTNQVSGLLNLTTQTQSSISLTNQVVGNLPLSQTSGSVSLLNQVKDSFNTLIVGSVTQQATLGGSSYTLNWPTTQGGASTVLTNNGVGSLSWTSVSGSSSGGVTAVGLIDSVPASSDGAVIGTATLFMQSYSATFPGLVLNSTSQTTSGIKTFSTALVAPFFRNTNSQSASSGAVRLTNGVFVNWRNNANTINIGVTVDANDTFTIGTSGGLAVGGFLTIGSGTASYASLPVKTDADNHLVPSPINLSAVDTVGSISLTNQVVNNLPLSQTSGSISLVNQVSGLLNLTTQTQSSISLTNQVVNNLPLSQTSGSISLTNQVSDNLPLTQTSGSVSLFNQVKEGFNSFYVGSTTFSNTPGSSTLTLQLPLNQSSSSQFLVNNGVGSLSWSSSIPLSTASISATFTVSSSNNVIFCNSFSYSVILYSAVGTSGKVLTITKTSQDSGNPITIATTASQSIIIGSSSVKTQVGLYTKGESFNLISDNTNWICTEHKIPNESVRFIPTGSLGSASYTGSYWRTGNKFNALYNAEFFGTPAAGGMTIEIPNQWTIDTVGVVNTTANKMPFGIGNIFDSGVQNYAATIYLSSGSTTLNVRYPNTDAIGGPVYMVSASATAPGTINSSDSFSFHITGIPILGWEG